MEQGTHSQDSEIHISVIICTRNRAASLRITLECLASANRDGIRANIIVVDNAGRDDAREVVDSFRNRIPISYLFEPTLGVFGKSHALNRALDHGELGNIIAVLDDDMSPHPDWFQGIRSVCRRWPDKDIFTGDIYALFPSSNVPEWAHKPRLQSWIFSAPSLGLADVLMQDGRWYSGNQFWFRSRVLETGRRFKDIWNTEPDFQLDLVELGFAGVASREVRAGHRIQPELLDRKNAMERARKVAVCNAWLRLSPYRTRIKQARLLREHPWAGRLFCLSNHLRWCSLYLISYLYPSDSARFEHRLIAMERKTTYLELLRASNRLQEYSWRR